MTPKLKKQTLKQLGANLAEARRRAGLTQAVVAKRLGISVAYVSLIERGGRNAPVTTIIELGGIVSASPLELLKAA
jgi:transcriptional regulator with XRE-family HTH domain